MYLQNNRFFDAIYRVYGPTTLEYIFVKATNFWHFRRSFEMHVGNPLQPTIDVSMVIWSHRPPLYSSQVSPFPCQRSVCYLKQPQAYGVMWSGHTRQRGRMTLGGARWLAKTARPGQKNWQLCRISASEPETEPLRNLRLLLSRCLKQGQS